MLMKKTNKFLMIAALLLFSTAIFAQGYIKGIVKDAESKGILIGATVKIEGTTIGAASDLAGEFTFEATAGEKTIVVSYVGYQTKTLQANVVDGKTTDLGVILLDPSAIGLAGINIIADRAKERETPVAMSNITHQEIEDRLGSRDIPLILNITPSVYATPQGGGAGDTRINVRGFNQRNVAIMINGVPINDMENGWVYWSNWDGIADATSSIQMQRGLSAVNLATPSIGGTMNVITSPAEMKGGVIGRFEAGSGNFMKSTITAHTGLIDEKFAMSASFVRKVGSGVVNATWTDAWAYYFGASYNINKNHRLEVYAIGAPQKHGQNIYKQNIATYDQDYAKSIMGYDTMAFEKFYEQGRLYNQNWSPVMASYDGKQSWNGKNDHDRYSSTFLNSRENFFHKPLANLNWYAQWNEKVSQFTTVYYSGGKGGGTGTIGKLFRRDANGRVGDSTWKFYYGPSPWSWDWNETIKANSGDSTTVYIDKKPVNRELGESVGVLRNSRNNQWTIGAISKVKVEWSETFKTTFGIDWRTAEIEHYREVRDLLGGQYYIDNGDEFNPNKKATLGDKIAYNFTNNVDWLGVFAQGEYHTELITAYATIGYSMVKYNHANHFIKDTLTGGELTLETDWISGYQFKGGLSYRVSEAVSIYGNAGYVSRVPILDATINDRTHELLDDPSNETFTSGELGLNFRSTDGKVNANLNLYHTYWKNRLVTDPYYDLTDDEGLFIINDLNAVHQGIEADFAIQPNKFIRLDGAVSVGNWKNTNNPKASLERYEKDAVDTTFTVYAKDLKTGDAPQTQFALAGTVFPIKGMFLSLTYRHYADFYADWNVATRIDKDDKAQSWKTPAYSVFDFDFGYNLPLKGKTQVQIFVHIFNLFNSLYIQDAVDNSQFNSYMGAGGVNSHSAAAAEVFLGLPRTFNAGLQISF